MNARMRRINSDYEEIQKKFASHKNIVVEPLGEIPAEKYKVTYYVNGIYLREDKKIGYLDKHIVFITLHSEYPRYKPICNIATPIWHPNFRDGQVCIGDIWGAGESLSDIIVNIGDMIQYKSWNSFSPLSADAAEWAIENKHMFPVGNINLWTGEEEENVKKEFDIEFFDENPSGEPELAVEGVSADDLEMPAKGFFDENTDADETVSFDAEQYSAADTGLTETQDIEDFEITAEELEGIEFVSSTERMQGSQYGATAKGGKFSFKTILFKGLLWALIGAFVGFGISEICTTFIGEAAVSRLMGQNNLARYFENKDKADKAFAPVSKSIAAFCKRNNIDPNSDEALSRWSVKHYDEYADEIEKWSEYTYKAEEALYKAYMNDFDQDEDELGDAIKAVGRLHTALWSAIIALFIGLFLGLGEGIYYGSAGKAAIYALIGAGISIAVGFASGYFAQWMYASMLTEDASNLMRAIVRGIGWAVMGVGIGLAVGLIKPGGKRIGFCSLGGFIGAFHGGFAFDYICEIIPEVFVARAVAIVVMGLLIGVGVGVLEQFAKSAWLKVIRGEFEGKEYLVFQGTTSIGNTGKNTIALFKDKLVAPNHCDIIQEGNKYVLVDKGSQLGTVVNGMRITRHVLRKGDIIAIGNSVLVFNTK